MKHTVTYQYNGRTYAVQVFAENEEKAIVAVSKMKVVK